MALMPPFDFLFLHLLCMLHPYKKNAREIQRRQWNVGEEFEEDSLTKYSPHLDHALYLSCGRNRPEPLWAPVCG